MYAMNISSKMCGTLFTLVMLMTAFNLLWLMYGDGWESIFCFGECNLDAGLMSLDYLFLDYIFFISLLTLVLGVWGVGKVLCRWVVVLSSVNILLPFLIFGVSYYI